MKNSAKKAIVSAPVASVIAPVVPAVVEEKKVLFGRAKGTPDAYGFGSETEASFIANGLRAGTYTRSSLLSAYLSKFAPDANETGNVKAKKTSFSVFLSDCRRPFGTYTGSRSFVIEVGKDTGLLSLDSKRDDTVREAVGAGILDRLRGKKGSERAAILREYGLPEKD